MNEPLIYSLWSFNVSNDFLILSANHLMQYGNVVIILINCVILLFKMDIIFVVNQKLKNQTSIKTVLFRKSKN